MKILLTGFEPYWDYPENSSWAVAEKVTACSISGVYIVAEQMPVSFERVANALRKAVEKHHPDLIIMLYTVVYGCLYKPIRVILKIYPMRIIKKETIKPNYEKYKEEL